MEPSDAGLLRKPPRDPKQGILTKAFLKKIFAYGILIAAVTQAAFYVGLENGPQAASTMAFVTLTLARLFHGFNCRSEKGIFRIGFTTNKWSIAAFVTGILFLACVLFIPFLSRLFMVFEVSAKGLGLMVCLAVLPTILIQVRRGFRK